MARGGSQSPRNGSGDGEKERKRGREKVEKFSRSTIACNGCRMRKQKVRFYAQFSGLSRRGLVTDELKIIVRWREVSDVNSAYELLNNLLLN
jgi:hypothetical protein